MHKLLSIPVRSFASYLLALLVHGAIRAGEGALDQNPGLYSLYSQLQPIHQRQDHAQKRSAGTRGILETLRGGANPNNRRRKHSSRAVEQQPGRGSGSDSSSGGASTPEAIEISGAELSDSSSNTGGGVGRAKQFQQQHIDGIYLREWDVNGAPHFKRRSKVS